MEINVTIPGREILSSGTIVLGISQEVFTVTVEDIVMNFQFIRSDGEPSAAFEEHGKTVNFKLMGFDNPLGTAYDLPDILTIGQHQVSIVLYVEAINVEPIKRAVHYTISTNGRA
jgi:O-acetylhomoserine/O-acetylserine sulfhydrylase-like pyridoxal-dependent enzyme